MDYNLDGNERRIDTMTLNIKNKAEDSIHKLCIVSLKIIFGKNLHQIETSQLICFANQLTGFDKNFYRKVFSSRL